MLNASGRLRRTPDLTDRQDAELLFCCPMSVMIMHANSTSRPCTQGRMQHTTNYKTSGPTRGSHLSITRSAHGRTLGPTMATGTLRGRPGRLGPRRRELHAGICYKDRIDHAGSSARARDHDSASPRRDHTQLQITSKRTQTTSKRPSRPWPNNETPGTPQTRRTSPSRLAICMAPVRSPTPRQHVRACCKCQPHMTPGQRMHVHHCSDRP